MTTPIRHTKGIERWRYISGGYDRYWYLRSALRWLTIAAAVTDLIVFAVLYSDWSEAYNVDTMYLGSVLFIVAVSNPLSTIRCSKLIVINSHCYHS